MKIAGAYSFNNGEQALSKNYLDLLTEIRDAIAAVDASTCMTKKSKEKTMPGQMLYSPKSLNRYFEQQFYSRGWNSVRVKCDYPTRFYAPDYAPQELRKGAFREMDFVKRRLGVEVQFGKYSFMVYNVAAKMTIFRNLGHIDAGVEIVPVKALADHMSSGVSYFEQFVWDLEKRGVSNIDVPVLILGIDV
ncbi:MAG TPA: BglII/BstYI family type II restriction endonuclease [Candidatus Brocadiia bacterium]|nr:BglII/BstYI family type II restriction endonuclease [Candidatus Brocadiia bacterium]